MDLREWKTYKRDALLGALSAFLMLVGDLCLSVIPASSGDSGLFVRQAYLSGSWEPWRLPVLLATGLCGMALGFFTVRVSYRQVAPRYGQSFHVLHEMRCETEKRFGIVENKRKCTTILWAFAAYKLYLNNSRVL